MFKYDVEGTGDRSDGVGRAMMEGIDLNLDFNLYLQEMKLQAYVEKA